MPITKVRGEVCWLALWRADFAEDRKDLRETRGRGIVSDVQVFCAETEAGDQHSLLKECCSAV